MKGREPAKVEYIRNWALRRRMRSKYQIIGIFLYSQMGPRSMGVPR